MCRTQSATPKAVLIPASEHSLNGDNAFGNSFSDLTVDVGRNPGAIAISYLVNNQGAIERVALRGSGHIGLALLRPTLGPGLISELTVDGFAMGIAAAGPCCSMVFEHILLRNQSVAGSEDQPSLFQVPRAACFVVELRRCVCPTSGCTTRTTC